MTLTTTHKRSWLLLGCAALLALAAPACGDEGSTDSDSESLDDWGKPTLDETGWTEPGGKEDAIGGRAGLPVSVDDSSTAVWEVKNAWMDTDTPAAREAGIAWGEDSGLNWDEKYQAWIGSMEKIDAEGHGQTFEMTTPYGKTLPAPSLECAEVAMFLRIVFASWYNLPWYMSARSNGQWLYFGHFGIRTPNGKYGNMPSFRRSYKDYTDSYTPGDEWPSDSKLYNKALVGQFDDEQPMIADGVHLGAYLDELLLNKRVGYFLMLQLLYFGSVNLADPSNMFNIEADAVDSGDVLLERWQRRGIGHTLVVLTRRELGTADIDGETVPQLEVELASGSMPRRQPAWDSPAGSKRYLTLDETGAGEYVDFGGGIKRWRTAANINGRWTNVIPTSHQDVWISTNAKDRLADRIDRFEKILTELTPEEKLTALLEIIEGKRRHLQQYPASCSARINRESAFDELYETGAELGMSRDEVDGKFRKLEDYVFAELVYDKSKTCCWNSSTSDMYEIVMEFNRTQMVDPETGTCNELYVFMNRDDNGDGYQLFRDFAEAMGRGDQWVDWRADETCPQSGVAQDTEADHDHAPFCSVYEDLQSDSRL